MDKDIAIFLIINVVILVAGGIIIYELLGTRINECIANPLTYGANMMQEDYGLEDLDCDCFSQDKRFSFNSTTMYTKEAKIGITRAEIPNFSELLQNSIIK